MYATEYTLIDKVKERERHRDRYQIRGREKGKTDKKIYVEKKREGKIKTRTEVVHKNISQDCNKVNSSS